MCQLNKTQYSKMKFESRVRYLKSLPRHLKLIGKKYFKMNLKSAHINL